MAKSLSMLVRLSVAEKESIDKAARASGKKTSTWVRDVLMEATGKKPPVESATDIPGAVKSKCEVKRKIGELIRKKAVVAAPVAQSVPGPQFIRNGKAYTGVSVVRFGRTAYEIKVGDRTEWTFDPPGKV